MGVHMMTVTKWERDGMPVAEGGRRGVPSLYDLDLVRAWRQARDAAADDAADGEATTRLSWEAARARKDEAQAKLAEQMYLVRAGKLLPQEDVERVWARIVSAVRTRLLQMPVTYADRLHRTAQLDGVKSVERLLEEAVHEVLRELAEGE
jgi:phage terminase Nu1 subunit (DNA packaging protein)